MDWEALPARLTARPRRPASMRISICEVLSSIHFCQTSSVFSDPLDLLDHPLLLDIFSLGAPQLRTGLGFLFFSKCLLRNTLMTIASIFSNLYCWLPLAVRGAKPGMKKCNLWKVRTFTSSKDAFTLGRAPYWRPTCANQHWAVQGTADWSWRPTWWATPGGSSPRRLGSSTSGCGSRYRRAPRYRYRMSRPCSPPAGARRGWHCKAPPRYQRPWERGQQSSCSWFCQDTPPWS